LIEMVINMACMALAQMQAGSVPSMHARPRVTAGAFGDLACVRRRETKAAPGVAVPVRSTRRVSGAQGTSGGMQMHAAAAPEASQRQAGTDSL
jgi:hypothetical protein